MRRIFSVLFMVLAAACTLAPNAVAAAPNPSPVVAPAPNPAPAAFTGGDATYEAMCAVAHIVVAMPDGVEHGGNIELCMLSEFNSNEYASETSGTHGYARYRVKICIDGQWETRWSYISLDDSGAMNVMGGIFARYDDAGEACSPAMPVCMQAPGGAKWYKMIVDEGGASPPSTICTRNGKTMWIDSNWTAIYRRNPLAVDLMLDTRGDVYNWDAWRPFKRPTSCGDLEVDCSEDITGSCTNN